MPARPETATSSGYLFSGRLLAAWGAALALSFLACNRGGTEVENELDMGRVFRPDGQPAAGASVRIVPVAHVPDAAAGSVYKLETDAVGRYDVSDIPAGEYNILAGLDGMVAYQDSVLLREDGNRLAYDTLGNPGSAEGVVALQPNHDPEAATVQLVGTTVYANVDAAGRFRLEGLAEGAYTLRVAVTEPEYTPYFARLVITPGQHAVLADTLRPAYTGISVLTGLRAAYDTASGVVRLTWKPSAYRQLLGYLVYRDPFGARTLSTEPIHPGRLTDTVYEDTLRWNLLSADEPNQKWEYRAAIMAGNGRYGETHEIVVVDAVTPARVKSFVEVSAEGLPEGLVGVGKPFRLVARFRNAQRKNVRIAWFAPGAATPVRDRALSAPSGSDTLEATAPGTAGTFSYRVEVTDEAGTKWSAQTTLQAVLWTRKADRPWLAYARAGAAPVDMPVVSLGGKVYVFGSRSADPHPLLSVYDPRTDRWTLKAEAPVLGTPVAVKGRLYLATGRELHAYDTAADAWTTRTDLPVLREPSSPVPILAYGGKVLLYGGNVTSRDPGGQPFWSPMETFDPDSGKWNVLQGPGSGTLAFSHAGRLFRVDYRALIEYQSDRNRWWEVTSTLPAPFVPVPIAPLGSTINLLVDGRLVYGYDLDRNALLQRAPLPPVGPYTDYSFQSVDGKMYGLFQTGVGRITVAQYRPAEDTWKLVAPIATRGNRFACAEVEGGLVIISYHDLKSASAEELPATYFYPLSP